MKGRMKMKFMAEWNEQKMKLSHRQYEPLLCMFVQFLSNFSYSSKADQSEFLEYLGYFCFTFRTHISLDRQSSSHTYIDQYSHALEVLPLSDEVS